MLDHLRIKNVALIDEIEVSLSQNLNILSGETGAGKSIIIDAINFVLGGRSNRDFIRSGENLAFVEALFFINNTEALTAIAEAGIEMDEDNACLIYRSVNTAGKSVCRINGRTVTLGMLKQITPLFIDLHGQHEHQSLMDANKHIELVDKFCGGELEELKNQLGSYFKKYKEILKDIATITGNGSDREAMIDLLKFQLNEIGAAKLKPNEEEQLIERRNMINCSEKLITSIGSSLELLYGADSREVSAADQISKALLHIRVLSELDSSRRHLADNLEAVYEELQEIVSELRGCYDTLEHDPGEIDKIETRLDLIYGLKKKYGGSIREVLQFYDKIKNKYDFIVNSEEELERLNEEKRQVEKEIAALCARISNLRKQAANRIEKEIELALTELGMKNARFVIQFEKKQGYTSNGYDKTEFMISPNQGESLKHLSKTASGGEMSRVMLALKAVLADVDNIETFIFDEIDTGVSGRTAQKVAEKLAALSCRHQILCITHLPQIAAMADAHFLIEKTPWNGRTITNTHKLAYDTMIKELARLTGGAEITESTLAASEEMKQMANDFKEKNRGSFLK